MPPLVYLETSHTALSNAHTGIQTVVRGLIAGLSSQGCAVHPLRWSFKRKSLTPLKPQWERNLGLPRGGKTWLPLSSILDTRFWWTWKTAWGMSYRTPVHRHPAYAELFKDGWLIMPELMEGFHVRLATDYARQRGMRVVGIFHDAIPWLHPEMVLHWTRNQHADYMMAFAELDAVIADSHQSARHFTEFVVSQDGSLPPVRVCRLAAQIAGEERATQLKQSRDGIVRILCVGTLEPRKNHARLIEAFELASSRLDERKMELHLVGAIYAGNPEIAESVRVIAANNPAIFWHGSVGTAELRKFYRDCDFTVFGSWIEGFGLPVMESLWFGKPCLCSDQGVIAENAEGGGCLPVNMQDVTALADGMVKLAGNLDFRRKLSEQALRRELKTWRDYAGEILGLLKGI